MPRRPRPSATTPFLGPRRSSRHERLPIAALIQKQGRRVHAGRAPRTPRGGDEAGVAALRRSGHDCQPFGRARPPLGGVLHDRPVSRHPRGSPVPKIEDDLWSQAHDVELDAIGIGASGDVLARLGLWHVGRHHLAARQAAPRSSPPSAEESHESVRDWLRRSRSSVARR